MCWATIPEHELDTLESIQGQALRDRPFLFLGTRAEPIYENLQKIFIPHENAINIFRTPSKSS